jgi:hypothetical protein
VLVGGRVSSYRGTLVVPAEVSVAVWSGSPRVLKAAEQHTRSRPVMS